MTKYIKDTAKILSGYHTIVEKTEDNLAVKIGDRRITKSTIKVIRLIKTKDGKKFEHDCPAGSLYYEHWKEQLINGSLPTTTNKEC